jgi:hypothetical protein
MQHSFFIILLAITLPCSSKHLPEPNMADQLKCGDTKSFCLFDHCRYQIIDTSCFIIYYRLKQTEKIPGKGVLWVGQYYFSKMPDDQMIELTTNNLKRSFPCNNRFHYALDAYFKSDKQLMEYDSYLKQYKLKNLFAQTMKE